MYSTTNQKEWSSFDRLSVAYISSTDVDCEKLSLVFQGSFSCVKLANARMTSGPLSASCIGSKDDRQARTDTARVSLSLSFLTASFFSPVRFGNVNNDAKAAKGASQSGSHCAYLTSPLPPQTLREAEQSCLPSRTADSQLSCHFLTMALIPRLPDTLGRQGGSRISVGFIHQHSSSSFVLAAAISPPSGL